MVEGPGRIGLPYGDTGGVENRRWNRHRHQAQAPGTGTRVGYWLCFALVRPVGWWQAHKGVIGRCERLLLLVLL